MKLKTFCMLPLLFCLCAHAFAADGEAQPTFSGASADPPFEIQAKAALLADPLTEDVLYGKDIHGKLFPASVTKIMTCWLALERGDLTATVEATESALADIPEDSSSVNPRLKVGEVLTLEDLLYCVMVASDNSACNIVAEHISGSVANFVRLMNAEAQRLGCTGTHFTNPHGLHDEEHYTTAWDIFRITQAAMKHPRFMDFANTIDHIVQPTNLTQSERVFYTTNHLISRFKDAGYVYHQAQGIKTGHTTPAGNCLVSAAEQGGKLYVCVVMGAPKLEDGTVRSFTETKELFEWGFASFEVKTLCQTKDIEASLPVREGLDHQSVSLVPENKVERLLPSALDLETVEKRVTLDEPAGILAPVRRGDVLGKLQFFSGESLLGEVNLVAAINVDRSTYDKTVADVTHFFDQQWVRYSLIGLGAAIVLYTLLTLVYNAARRRARRKDALYTGRYRGKKRY